MPDYPRYTINRSLIILRYQQPFLDWVMSADPTSAKALTLAQLEDDADAFLIPGGPLIDSTSDAVKWIEKRWGMLFEHILNDCISDEDLWPQQRSLAMFRQWFTVEYHSMVWDLTNKPLEIEDWSDDADTGEVIH